MSITELLERAAETLRGLRPRTAGALDKKPTISCQSGLARGIVFQKGATARSEVVIGAGDRGFSGAKRNGVEGIENKRFRVMPHFAPLMISRAYACVAKPFVSLGEMKSFDFAGFPPRRGPKRNGREIDGGLRACATDVARLCDPEGRRMIANGAASHWNRSKWTRK